MTTEAKYFTIEKVSNGYLLEYQRIYESQTKKEYFENIDKMLEIIKSVVEEL